MSDVCGLIWYAVAALFRSRAALQAEILVLRHQLNVLHRSSPRRVPLSNVDRLVFVGLYRVAATVLDALKIVQPETVIRWLTPVSELIGGGDHDRAAAGHRSLPTFAGSFLR